MDQEAAWLASEQQIFAAPNDILELLAGQQSADLGADRPTQPGLAYDHRLDWSSANMGQDAPAGGFNFWEFRQTGNLAGVGH
jgi:hypothetical protein